jgi:hypothetical protein
MTPFDAKAVVYSLMEKIHWGCQAQSPWWQFFMCLSTAL